MTVYEPCNYASNIAFYHAAKRACDYEWSIDDKMVTAVKRNMATMGAGSSFWHGSHTFVGYSFDNQMISAIAYLAHQAITGSLAGDSSVLKELSDTPRNLTSAEVSEQLTLMFSNQPVVEWSETINTIDMPHDYFVIFGAIIGSLIYLLMPYMLAHFFMEQLTTNLLKPDQTDFLMNKYLPEFHEQTKHLELTEDEKTSIFEKFVGCLMKLLGAFCYQEHYIPVPELWGPMGLRLAAFFMPYYNKIADDISKFPESDSGVKRSKNVYPGDDYCRTYQAHSIWHEESASGLIELVFVADAINKVIQNS